MLPCIDSCFSISGVRVCVCVCGSSSSPVLCGGFRWDWWMVILQLSFHVIFWKIFSEYKQWVYSSYNSTILSTDGSST